jgi:ferredoxin
MDFKNPQNSGAPVILKNGWTVEVDHSVCIGAAPCTAMAPNSFGLDGEGKAGILATIDQDDIETILNAARACPVAAIRIKNEKGETVFPE